MAEMPIIHVPDVDPPTAKLCYKLKVVNGVVENWEHCDRKAGHGGECVWAMWEELVMLRNLRTKLEEEVTVLDHAVRAAQPHA
jgi:hypothetical protein